MPRKAQVEPVDLGKPGEYYFAEPQMTEIKSPKPEPVIQQQQYHQSSAATYGEGACRLPTSHIIHGYTPPKGIEYHLSRWPAKKDVDAYLEMMEVQGFGAGAVVCRKYQPLNDHPKVYKWGAILMVHSFNQSAEYKPYLVKWFGDGQVESAWGEDLFLVHAKLDQSTFWSILEAQDLEPVGSTT